MIPRGPIRAPALLVTAGLEPLGPVRWGEPVACKAGGVYVVEIENEREHAPLDPERVQVWRSRTSRPSLDLHERWWPSSLVVYVGRSSRPVAQRVREFGRHILGERSPHRGGELIKTFTSDVHLRVWWSESGDSSHAERQLLEAFREALIARDSGLSEREAADLLPFANLRT